MYIYLFLVFPSLVSEQWQLCGGGGSIQQLGILGAMMSLMGSQAQLFVSTPSSALQQPLTDTGEPGLKIMLPELT